jgi:hypothetical protein
MRTGSMLFTLVAFLGLTLLGNVASQEENDRDDTPNFIFSGTVKALESSNVPHVKATKSTAVVTVDDVLSDLPKAMRNFKGQEVTVELSKPLGEAPLRVGQKLVFSTQGHVYGPRVAVREVGDRGEVPQANAAAKVDPALKRQLSTASAVVTGTVEEIRPLPATKILAAGKAAEPRRPISEHDPDWHTAVVRVDSVEKGQPGLKRLVVVFPQSGDIAWRRAPKFTKDQKGTWLLHKQQIRDAGLSARILSAAAAEYNADSEAAYTCLDPKDFIPAHGDMNAHLDRIRDMIKVQP